MTTSTEINFSHLLTSAIEQKASELYIAPGQHPFVRIDGQLRNLTEKEIITVDFIHEVINLILTPREQEIFEREREIVLAKEINKLGRFKIRILYEKSSPVCSFKIIPKDIPELSDLKIPTIAKDFVFLNRGLVIISGPPDSGKSTLLASLINQINKTQTKYIATLEKPIEYKFFNLKSLIEQREVGRDVKGFLAGLTSLKDRKVDVVVISELDQPEVIIEVLRIAEAGGLVFAMMESASIPNCLEKIFSYFPAEQQTSVRILLSENIAGIICQKLIPRIGGGRILALEVIPALSSFKKIIRDGKLYQFENIFISEDKRYTISFDQFLANLVRLREITLEEAIKQAKSEENLKAMLTLTE